MLRTVRKRSIDVTAGIHQGNDRRTGDGDGLGNVELMTIHEFGNETNPERSVIRVAWDDNLRTYRKMAAFFWGNIATLKMTQAQGAEMVGRKLWHDQQDRITDGPFVPNTPQTAAVKGHSMPLIDTYQLARALDYQVRQTGASR